MKKNYKVSGLHCGGCAASLKMELLDIDGVKDAILDESLQNLTVEGDKLNSEDVKKAVEVCGFNYLGEA